MFFKRIEMHGFKSFAEPVTIEFDRGITCVVGPNGSGKSNISDAIRWVLGEQSPKMLRGSRMDDVIFAGTASRKSRGMAEVTLVIDNSDNMLPIEYSEVAITRRMYRSGESEYAINGNSCRMKDIRELLMDTGIGVDGYSLIGQGKISEIISNKTESIREIFEETAGIVSYRSKKAEAERKLAAASDNMARVTDIISEIEGRIDGLREDSAKATEYLTLRDRHKQLEVNITVRNIDDIQEKATQTAQEAAQLESELKASYEERETRDKEARECRAKIQELEEQYRQADEELKENTERANRLTGEKNVSRERLAGMERDIRRIGDEIGLQEKRIKEEQESEKQLLNKKADIDKRYEELKKHLEEESARHGDVIGERDRLSQDVDALKNELFEISSKKSGWNAEKISLENLAVNLEENRLELIKEADAEAGNRKSAAKALEEFEKTEKEMSAKLDSLRTHYDELLTEKKKAESDRTLAERHMAEARMEAERTAARKRAIEEMENNYEGYNGGVRAVMRSGINGIEGVVAELIEVPKGYETAVETALGAAAQNIICADDKTAKAAINMLKEKKAGRLTFLPVASIKSRGVMKDREVEGAAGFVGYAAECVDFDERHRNIAEYLLGSVAIIDNMDNAVRISKSGKRGLRYVTLDGEVINASGAVTGGRYKNRTAGLFERKSEINELTQKAEKLTSEIEDAENTVNEAVKKLRKNAEKIESAEKEIRNAEIGLMDISGRKNIAEKTFNDIERATAARDDSVRGIDEEKTKLEEQIKSLAERIADAEERTAQAEASIEEKTARLENMAGDILGANELMTKARIELGTCQGEKENTDNLLNLVRETIKGCQEDIENKKTQIEGLTLDMQAITEGVNAREEEIASLTIKKEKAELAIGTINAEKGRCMKLSEELSDAVGETDRKIRSLQDMKYSADVKAARYDGQLENLKNKLWDDFEISYAQALTMKDEDFVMSSAVKENRQIRNRIKELGEVNVGAIKEYEQVSERYTFLTEQREDIRRSTDELNSIIADTDRVIKKRFNDSFDQITGHFEKIFTEFFGGGHAKISLDNEEDPLNATIEITAQPPGKQLKNINLLSGGEKTMTAIALMFAVLRTKPTPCCILDEVEAALDDHNIHVFANYLRKFDNIQFTLITHQKTTMEHADVMYGVTMPERGISKVFSLKMTDELPV